MYAKILLNALPIGPPYRKYNFHVLFIYQQKPNCVFFFKKLDCATHGSMMGAIYEHNKLKAC